MAGVLADHARVSRQEPGCDLFLVARDERDGDRFVLFEQYHDEAAFRAHRLTPHFRQNIDGVVASMLEEREWSVYTLVAE